MLVWTQLALAQGTVAQHGLAVGRGPSISSFNSVGPCTIGQSLNWLSNIVDPSCNNPAASNQTLWYSVTGWGDSLTQGNQDAGGVTWPNQLSVYLPGANGNNEGVGGQTSVQIGVRQGGITTTVTVSGSSVPTSGGVTVTFPSGFEPVTIQGPNYLPVVVQGVPGILTFSGSIYTFTRSYAGTAVSAPGSATFSVVTDNLNKGTNVIWAGTNDFNNPTQVQASIASMVALLPSPKRHLVMSIVTGEGQGVGTTPYTQITALNTALATTYTPNNHYFDIRAYLVSQYNPSIPADVLDHNIDVTPYSLRAVDLSGTITGSINNSTCFIPLSTAPSLNDILTIGSELIYVSGVSSLSVTACTRGYASTSAASHTSGDAFTSVDPIHLNGAGYKLVAQQVAAWVNTFNAANPATVNYSSLSGLNNPYLVVNSVGPLLAVGATRAGTNAQVGSNTTAIGNGALDRITSGVDVTAVGGSALANCTSCNFDDAFGYQTLLSLTTGLKNSGFGAGAFAFTTTGGNNVGVGYQVGLRNVDGSNNIAISPGALVTNVSGNNNICGGVNACGTLNGASNTVAWGVNAATAITTGSNSLAIGTNALKSGTTSHDVIAIGTGSCPDNVNGNNNICIGSSAGGGLVSGSNNVIIGTNVGGLSASLSGNIILADGAGTVRLQFDNTGNPSINGTAAVSCTVGTLNPTTAVITNGVITHC